MLTELLRDIWDFILSAPVMTVTVVAVLVFLGWAVVEGDKQFRAECARKGGVTRTHTEYGTGTTVTGNGQIGTTTTTSTTYFCLTPDGRILDIR